METKRVGGMESDSRGDTIKSKRYEDSEWTTLEVLVRPIENMKKEGALKVLRVAAQECLGDETLMSWRGIEAEKVSDGSDMEDDDEVEWGGFAD
jgi:ribosomal RNA-processing protein 1